MKHITRIIFIAFSFFLVGGCGEENTQYYQVLFYGYHGVLLKQTSVKGGNTVPSPKAPDIIGHSFLGWDTDFTIVERNLEIFALYEPNSYSVNLYIDDDLYESFECLYDSQIGELPQPQQEGYEFVGWYFDRLAVRPFDQVLMPAEDLELYAKFDKSFVTIDFYTNCDEILQPYYIYPDYPVFLPELEKRVGYLFVDWFVEPDFKTVFSGDLGAATHINLYAKWELINYQITFHATADEPLEPTFYPFNGDLDSLIVPTKQNFRFLGWFEDNELTKRFEETVMPARHLDLYAKWESMLPFINRIGDQLFEGANVFRFVSFNIPNLHILEDPDWHLVDAWEQEDALSSIKQLGGQVVRIYTLSVVGGVRPLESNNKMAHILGPEEYNEELFRCLDKAIELAGKYGIRLIIPIIDEWQWFGGIQEFSTLYGKSKSAFFTNSVVKAGFKHLLNYLLNRTNTFTGIKYKDDPAILAWELGNELRSATNAWIGEMASYIKGIDPQHLVMSGRDQVTTYDLECEFIDLISSHYYTNNGTGTFTQRAKTDRLKTKGMKPFIVGEYGLTSYSEIEALVEETVHNGTTGSLIWSFRFRCSTGGFYYHDDGVSRSYHYPGFSVNDDYHEIDVINLLKHYGFFVQGKGPAAPSVPAAPLLFAIDAGQLTWCGATGSQSYKIERSANFGKTWQVIAENVIDALSKPFFIDNEGVSNQLYLYRICAYNTAGSSEYSNIESYLFP